MQKCIWLSNSPLNNWVNSYIVIEQMPMLPNKFRWDLKNAFKIIAFVTRPNIEICQSPTSLSLDVHAFNQACSGYEVRGRYNRQGKPWVLHLKQRWDDRGASCSFGHPPLNRVTKLDRLLFQDVVPNSYDLRERYFLSLSSWVASVTPFTDLLEKLLWITYRLHLKYLAFPLPWLHSNGFFLSLFWILIKYLQSTSKSLVNINIKIAIAIYIHLNKWKFLPSHIKGL